MNPRPNIPELVYEYALKRNLEALRQLQAQGHCLTQFHYAFHDDFNAIAKLAFDGHGDAAEFLVDHLIGSINDLVTGYAHAGNIERTLHWVSRGGRPTLAGTGFGYAGDADAIDDLIKNHPYKKEDNIIDDTRPLRYFAVIGLAKGSHHALLDEFINKHFSDNPWVDGLFGNRHWAIKHAVSGYAKRHNKRGLTLAADNHINVDETYYADLSVHTPMESIPQEKIRYFLPMAAKFGYDEPISNHTDGLDENEKTRIALGYYEGGHQPPLGAHEVPQSDITCALVKYEHFMLVETYLDDPETDRQLAKKDGSNYRSLSSYLKASRDLSKYEETQTRQLLQIKDDAKREHLFWSAMCHPANYPRNNTPRSLKLKRINHLFRQTPLGFDCAMTLGSNQERLVEALNLILFSLYRCAHPLTNHQTLPLILAHLLNTTGANAAKIHKHLAVIFKKRLSPNRPLENNDTLTQTL